jgi:hypothetical protein
MWVESEWLDDLLTSRYWQIRQLHSSSMRPYPLVEAEVRQQVARLVRLQAELEAIAAEQATVDLDAARVLPDTNFHLHFRIFKDVDWRIVASAKTVRLVIPIVTIRELDNHKNLGRHPVGHRATSRLRALQDTLAGRGRGPVPVREGVTLEILVDPLRHRREPNNDEEFLARATSFQRRPGGSLTIVTGDLSMRLQAEALGLSAMMLGDEYREPVASSG